MLDCVSNIRGAVHSGRGGSPAALWNASARNGNQRSSLYKEFGVDSELGSHIFEGGHEISGEESYD